MTPDYLAMLGRICMLAGVPAQEQVAVLEQEAMLVDGMVAQFRLEHWSGFIRIYVEVDKPAPSRLPALCQAILEQQLTLPAPFAMLTALDAASGCLVVYGCAPLSVDEEGDRAFLALLHGCVDAAALLRGAIAAA